MMRLLLFIGLGFWLIVVFIHIAERLHLFPKMGWGLPHSPGHYLDLASAIAGAVLVLLPFGFWIAKKPKGIVASTRRKCAIGLLGARTKSAKRGKDMRFLAALCIATTLAACSVMRANEAQQAQSKLVGLNKERILACMGPPARKATAGGTEVWSYDSGNGYVAGSGLSSINLSAHNGLATGYGSSFGVAHRRFCTVNVVMNNSVVTKVNYLGPTGGLLTQGEQCAYAIDNCLH